MALKYIQDTDLSNKKVLARFDFNVPLDAEQKITDTTRIDMALPTIQHILDQGVLKLILISHLGRPKGKADAKFSLEPVAAYLADKLGEDIHLTEAAVDTGLENYIKLGKTKIILLENIRFHAEEESNDRDFARKLSTYADVFVNDAFGTAHRKHASTYEINAFFENQNFGGFLLQKEIKALTKIVERPDKPIYAIVGGAKVSDKIKTIERLLPNVGHLFIGGAMVYPFLKAQGHTVGTSLCSDEDVKLAKRILQEPSSSKIILPIDHIVSSEFNGPPEECCTQDIPNDKMGLDIGPKTLELFASTLAKAKTILWNGPMGVFENDDYAKGTLGVAKILADSKAFTVVGGGDSVSAVKKSGLADQLSHVSTGGGASLEFIENGSLPGIQALKFGL